MQVSAISLYGLEQAVLILLDSNGIVYSNQVGGTACMQPTAKGFLVPITNDPPLDNLYHESLTYRLGLACEDIDISAEMVDRLDKVLNDSVISLAIKVDRGRLSESMESWIYVKVKSTDDWIIDTDSWVSAILTWPNSD